MHQCSVKSNNVAIIHWARWIPNTKDEAQAAGLVFDTCKINSDQDA